jgi:hypothetical protein
MIKKLFHSRVSLVKNLEDYKIEQKPIKNFYKKGDVIYTDKMTILKGILL